jgi:glycosyltransferase involved in cell wall biosynthesis
VGRAARSLSFICGGLLWLSRRHNEFKILHCHQAYSAATVAILAKRWFADTKVIVKITISGQLSEMSAVTRDLPLSSVRRRLLRHVDAFVAISEDIAQEIEASGFPGDRIVRIPNGVAVPPRDHFSSTARSKSRDQLQIPWRNVVVFSGRLASEKGLFVLLDAWKKVAAKVPDSGLLIVGDGGPTRSIEKDLHQRACELELSDSIRFTGRLSDVSPALAAANVIVQPSFAEGMSNAVLEAMSFSRPVVATDLPCNQELIHDGVNGLLVPQKHSDRLAEALIEVLSSPQQAERMGTLSRLAVKQKYSFERVAEQYRALYQDLLSNDTVSCKVAMGHTAPGAENSSGYGVTAPQDS